MGDVDHKNLRDFVAECLVMESDASAAATDVLAAYHGWCERQQKEPVEPRRFWAEIAQVFNLRCHRCKVRGARVALGNKRVVGEKNTGGPAFPTIRAESPGDAQVGTYVTTGDRPGMTLRDYFAAAALPAIIAAASRSGSEFFEVAKKVGGNTCEQVNSNIAYRYADAMIEARGG